MTRKLWQLLGVTIVAVGAVLAVGPTSGSAAPMVAECNATQTANVRTWISNNCGNGGIAWVSCDDNGITYEVVEHLCY